MILNFYEMGYNMSATQHLIFIDSELLDFSAIIENLPAGSTWQ